MITADGCCFEVRLPIREQDHGPVQRFVLGYPAAAPAGSPPDRKPQHPAGAQRVTRAKAGVAASTPAKPNELTVRRDGDVTIVRYGTPGAAAMRVVIECGEGGTVLHEELRKRGDAIEAGGFRRSLGITRSKRLSCSGRILFVPSLLARASKAELAHPRAQRARLEADLRRRRSLSIASACYSSFANGATPSPRSSVASSTCGTTRERRPEAGASTP